MLKKARAEAHVSVTANTNEVGSLAMDSAVTADNTISRLLNGSAVVFIDGVCESAWSDFTLVWLPFVRLQFEELGDELFTEQKLFGIFLPD